MKNRWKTDVLEILEVLVFAFLVAFERRHFSYMCAVRACTVPITKTSGGHYLSHGQNLSYELINILLNRVLHWNTFHNISQRWHIGFQIWSASQNDLSQQIIQIRPRYLELNFDRFLAARLPNESEGFIVMAFTDDQYLGSTKLLSALIWCQVTSKIFVTWRSAIWAGRVSEQK